MWVPLYLPFNPPFCECVLPWVGSCVPADCGRRVVVAPMMQAALSRGDPLFFGSLGEHGVMLPTLPHVAASLRLLLVPNVFRCWIVAGAPAIAAVWIPLGAAVAMLVFGLELASVAILLVGSAGTHVM